MRRLKKRFSVYSYLFEETQNTNSARIITANKHVELEV